MSATTGDVKKKKTRNGSKVVTDNIESSLNKKKVFEGNSSEVKKKRKHDVSESANSVPAKKSKKESSKEKEKLKALSKRKWKKMKTKMKTKKAKKLLEAKGEEAEKSGVGSQISSLEYLRQWKKDKRNWSFQKVRQVWLLQNMYNVERVPEEDFAILLEYLEGLQGAARKITVEKAEKIMKDADDTEDVEAEKSTFSEEQLDRVRQVLQLL